MAKPRLIKKQEVIEREQTSQQASQQDSKQQKVVKKTVNIVVEWLDNQRGQSKDPRKAFAALFAQPQEQ
jgi:hypothetical protein